MIRFPPVAHPRRRSARTVLRVAPGAARAGRGAQRERGRGPAGEIPLVSAPVDALLRPLMPVIRVRRELDLFKGLSFDTISATGPNAAIIHYKPEPTDCAVICRDQVYLCDSGGQYWDGTTDVTRTWVRPSLVPPTTQATWWLTRALRSISAPRQRRRSARSRACCRATSRSIPPYSLMALLVRRGPRRGRLFAC